MVNCRNQRGGTVALLFSSADPLSTFYFPDSTPLVFNHKNRTRQPIIFSVVLHFHFVFVQTMTSLHEVYLLPNIGFSMHCCWITAVFITQKYELLYITNVSCSYYLLCTRRENWLTKPLFLQKWSRSSGKSVCLEADGSQCWTEISQIWNKVMYDCDYISSCGWYTKTHTALHFNKPTFSFP